MSSSENGDKNLSVFFHFTGQDSPRRVVKKIDKIPFPASDPLSRNIPRETRNPVFSLCCSS